MADMIITERLKGRFFKYVDKSGDCWEWTGGKPPAADGYGVFNVEKKTHRGAKAHRVSWVIHNGQIPNGLYVCHTCDNRSCVNPSHLFLGTHADNMRDMKEKGRCIKPFGSKHWNSKLNPENVQSIRSEYATGDTSQRKLAKKYSVSQRTISKVLNDISYIHD